jgi:hypothetical protein
MSPACRDWLKFKGTSKNRRYFSDAAKFEDSCSAALV